MTRLPLLLPSQLDTAQRRVYDAVVGGRRAGGPQHFSLRLDDGSLTGPFNALLYAPEVGERLSALGEAIRFDTSLTAREREIAILAVAAARRASFEWYAHERVGRASGLTDGELRALHEGEDPRFSDERESAVLRVVRQLVARGELDEQTYGAVVKALGEKTLVEIVVLVGYYELLALLLAAFHVGVPEGRDPFDEWSCG